MIVIKLELWPRGRQVGAKEIGRMYVANDGAGTSEQGDYRVAVCRRGSIEVPREITPMDHLDPDDARAFEADHPKAARAGVVKSYPRLSYNVWRLIARSILAAFPEETLAAKKTVRPMFDTFVARGFELLAAPARAALRAKNAVFGLPPGQDGEALHAALEWLDASKRDDA